MTGERLRAAIGEACSLVNPRLSEVDWDAVAAVLDGRPQPVQRPLIDYEITRLAGIPLDHPIAFTAPADATDAELTVAANEALVFSTGEQPWEVHRS